MKVLDDAGLSTAEREQILWKTAAKLFKLDHLIGLPAAATGREVRSIA